MEPILIILVPVAILAVFLWFAFRSPKKIASMSSPHPKYDEIAGKRSEILSLSPTTPHECFLKEEVLRFISIAGTVAQTFPNVATSIDERILSHIMLRSVIENFFKIIYVFDDPSQMTNRFDRILDGFRCDYSKLFNDIDASFQNQIENPGAGWNTLQKAPDLKSMLAQVRNTFGTRLDYLYFIYRIGSFDTHGNSLNAMFEAVFAKKCNFPFLQIIPVIELIADQYLCTIAPLLPPAKPSPLTAN